MGGDTFCFEHLGNAVFDREVTIRPAEKGATCQAGKGRCGNSAPFLIIDKVLLAINEGQR